MELAQYGFYKLKDEYFSDFPNERHMHNKSGNRPYYLAVKNENGIIWLIPISSKVDKYRAKIFADEGKYGECLIYHIIRFMREERVVLIGNMIPVIPQYIEGEFVISGYHYIVRNAAVIKAINKRCSKYLSLVRSGRMHPYVDILSIEKELLSRMEKT